MLGFNTALSALTAARVALDTIGHNIANANTEGYSRQRVLLSAFLPQRLGPGLVVGAGVGVDSVDQVIDTLIVSRLRAQAHEVGRAGGQLDVYRDLEAALGEPSNSGLNSRFSDFFAALGQLQTGPGDSTLRTGAIQSAASLAQSFRTIRADLGSVSNTVDQSIQYEVNKANKVIEDLAELNHSIVVSGFGGALPPDLRDRQNQLLAELSKSVDIHVSQAPTGQITVSSSGQVLVDPNGSSPIRVLPRQITGQKVQLRTGYGVADFKPRSGRLSSLLESAPQVAADGLKALDDMAHGLIRALNHAHATGVPPSGGYSSVVGVNAFQDVDLDGNILSEKLTDVGLPFEMQNGLLTISVHDPSGNVNQTRVAVLPDQMTVANLLTALNSVNHLSATVDSTGRLRITSDPGYKFDFSNTLNPTPDATGTFGGAQATLVAALPFPMPIPPGLQFQIAIDGGAPQTVTFQANQFANPAAATPEEMAAAINAQVTGAHASVVTGRLVLQSATVGSSSSLQLNNVPIVRGQDTPVHVAVSGTYSGAQDQSFILSPTADGVIGQTPNLKVQIHLPNGQLIGTVDVGLGYTPGEPLEVRDGIKVSFSAGSVSQTAGQFVTIDAIADGDQSGILVASGVNALFEGHDAATIAVRQELLDNQDLLATGMGGGTSDGSNIARLLAARDEKIASLGDRTVLDRFERCSCSRPERAPSARSRRSRPSSS